MAQIFDIQRVDVGLENLTARVRVANDAPLKTSEDLVGTTRIYNLMPHIIEHVCLGDAGETFKDVMGNTELAHLLEHMTVELLSQSSAAAEVTTGRTYPVEGDERMFDVVLSCSDDVLVVGALSSAVWIANWAFGGGGEPEPDVEAIVGGLTNMVRGLGEGPEAAYRRSIENMLQAEANAEYQRLYNQRIQEITAREQEIAAARAAAQAEAQELMAEERARIEEEARLKAAAEAAAEAARRPSWAVDVDEFETRERERKEAEAAARAAAEAAAQAAAEQEASERAALSAQGIEEPVEEEVAEVEEPAVTAETIDPAEDASFASQLSDIFSSRPQVDPLPEPAAELESVEEPRAEVVDAVEDDEAEEPIETDGNFAEPVEELLSAELPWVDPAAPAEEPAAEELAEVEPEVADESVIADAAISGDEEHIPQARRVR